MPRTNWLIAFIIALIVSFQAAYAVQPDEVLTDPVLEQRARDISLDLRCLVCQNQSIDDSDAPLAKDLRVLVRDRLTKGDSDEQVIDFIVARYGEFVLLRPRFGAHTLVLWLAPPILLLLGLFLLFRFFSQHSRQSAESGTKSLTSKEKRELDRLLKKT